MVRGRIWTINKTQKKFNVRIILFFNKTMEQLFVINKQTHKPLQVGQVYYDAVPTRVWMKLLSFFENILTNILKTPDNDHCELIVDDDLLLNNKPIDSPLVHSVIGWINEINPYPQKRVVKITYNGIVDNYVDTKVEESYYIISVPSQDWRGCVMSIEYKDYITRKYSKDPYYVDDIDDNEHYYEGGTLIVNPSNGKSRIIKATDSVIFHLK